MIDFANCQPRLARPRGLSFAILLCSFLGLAPSPRAGAVTPEPLAMGETFTLDSKVLKETRRINVYLPPGYDRQPNREFPVLYMPDGGMAEDFLHIAGLVQISTINGTMRPFVLVGIENTERRRDLSGPTSVEKDKEIAPRVGGSAAFRRFLRDELMPAIRATYRTTTETAIVGESLAGLFVVETLLLEPSLFDTYIAIDPSLWWNNQYLVRNLETLLERAASRGKHLYMAGALGEIALIAGTLHQAIGALATGMIESHYTYLPEERHHTIYHPAALRAFRALFPPPPPTNGE